LVEVIEQEVEHNSVHQNDPRERLRVVAFDEEQLRRMNEDHDELYLKSSPRFKRAVKLLNRDPFSGAKASIELSLFCIVNNYLQIYFGLSSLLI